MHSASYAFMSYQPRKDADPYDASGSDVKKCLRNTFGIFRPETISNSDLWSLAKDSPILGQIRRRKWNWIGHALPRTSGVQEEAFQCQLRGNENVEGQRQHGSGL
ncbi:jg761 [Pararge aegeria aegeria]|uniref:Jg761 protein n=1 Tax=Pararge aegeria aegeria TaxID=348720 RepID=A0A8S4S737_9NEOP|nr:jg761 [Pararge aegeria aegeria]